MAKKNYPAYKKIMGSLQSISQADLAYELEKDIKLGLTSDQLRRKYQARLTARSILIGLSAEDETKANSAIRDITDRVEGKPMEKRDVTHHLEKLSDEQLEAMLRSEIDDLAITNAEKAKTLQ